MEDNVDETIKEAKTEKETPKWKKFIKNTFIVLGILIIIFVLLILVSLSKNWYEKNIKYSIAMPTIYGKFSVSDDGAVSIRGIENIIGDNIVSLAVNEIFCLPTFKECSVKTAAIVGFGSHNDMWASSKYYKIKYMDKNRIIFGDNNDTGDIDKIAKTVNFTYVNNLFPNDKPKKTEIITDDKKIEELEKKIIRKYLRTKFWG